MREICQNLLKSAKWFTFVSTPTSRSLRVLDGSVLLLDGSAGVQAQTVTVWRQARRNRVPCIAFVNKMDKPAADLGMTTRSIRRKLGVTPLVTQLPIGQLFATE